jgi:hypothetical protein
MKSFKAVYFLILEKLNLLSTGNFKAYELSGNFKIKNYICEYLKFGK